MIRMLYDFNEKIVPVLSERRKYSPDIPELRQYKHHAVLVYDSHKQGGVLHKQLAGAKYLGMGHTVRSGYEMKTNGFMPVIFERPVAEYTSHSVRGEVYLVSTEHLIVLDYHFQQGEMMARRKDQVYVEEQYKENYTNLYTERPWISAFIYVGIHKSWEDEIGFKLHNNIMYSNNHPNHHRMGNRQFYEWTIPKITSAPETEEERVLWGDSWSEDDDGFSWIGGYVPPEHRTRVNFGKVG